MSRFRRGKVHALGPVSGASSETIAPPPSTIAVGEPGVRPWVERARGRPDDRDGPPAGVERRGVGGAVDADRQPGHDRRIGRDERPGDPRREGPPAGRRPARPDDGDGVEASSAAASRGRTARAAGGRSRRVAPGSRRRRRSRPGARASRSGRGSGPHRPTPPRWRSPPRWTGPVRPDPRRAPLAGGRDERERSPVPTREVEDRAPAPDPAQQRREHDRAEAVDAGQDRPRVALPGAVRLGCHGRGRVGLHRHDRPHGADRTFDAHAEHLRPPAPRPDAPPAIGTRRPRRDAVAHDLVAGEVGDGPRDAQQSLRARVRWLAPRRRARPPAAGAAASRRHADAEGRARSGGRWRPCRTRPPRRAVASARAAAIRPATMAEASGSDPPTMALGATRGMSIHRSIRSRKGPDTRRSYRSTTPGRAAAAAVERPGEPARTRVHRGDELEPCRERRRPAGPSDRDPTLLERLAQRLEHVPVELRQLVEEQHAVIREGHLAGRQSRTAADHRRRRRSCGAGAERRPADEPGRAVPRRPPRRRRSTSRAAASSSGGSRPGTVRASRVLPTPGGPISSSPWPPARAISSARRASAWPRTSARSGYPAAATDAWRRRIASGRRRADRVRPDADPRSRIARPAGPWRPDGRDGVGERLERHDLDVAGQAASAAADSATAIRRIPRRASAATIGRMPGTARTSPPSDSSPRSPTRRGPGCTCSDPSRIPIAIARSSDAPALRRSAGARLTVIRRGGWT